MQTIEKLLTYPEVTDAEVAELLQKASDIVIGNLDDFTEFFQHSNSENGFYKQVPNVSWTTGFWTGEIWLAYEKTKDERLKKFGSIKMIDSTTVSMCLRFFDWAKFRKTKAGIKMPTSRAVRLQM